MKCVLSEISQIKVGYQSPTKINASMRGRYRIIQGKDIEPGAGVKKGSLTTIVPVRKPERYLVKLHDILFQARGTRHFALHIDAPLGATLAGNVFYILRPDMKRVLPEYLVWYLNRKSVKDYLSARAGGAIISFISKATLSKLEIELPDMAKQKQIVKSQRCLMREQKLLLELHVLKAKLTDAVCMNAVHQTGDNNG